ncbi:hypothetical protein Ahy_A06g030005 isoform C [Arachis hypogaea]|uniref:Uncharacterized protein n=1 Tax=Arachis hypogaea TaxID=3818 RepID=A0A445CUV3_ARAHY|nr:hypothetical protein Ahy_A06g030005 isoform C [Arachis hypogaea]
MKHAEETLKSGGEDYNGSMGLGFVPIPSLYSVGKRKTFDSLLCKRGTLFSVVGNTGFEMFSSTSSAALPHITV